MATYRAIEEGIPVVRAASNGVTGLINPYGHYEIQLGPKATGVIDVRLPTPLQTTAFSWRTSYYLLLLNLVVAFMCLTVGIRNKRVSLS